MSITETLQKHAREFLREALAAGTWVRIRTGSTGSRLMRQ